MRLHVLPMRLLSLFIGNWLRVRIDSWLRLRLRSSLRLRKAVGCVSPEVGVASESATRGSAKSALEVS